MALTERERQILRLHTEGLNDYQIAKEIKDGNTQRNPFKKECSEKA